MPETRDYSPYTSQNQESPTKLRDIEEKQRLLKDRLLLLGQTHIEEREKTFSETIH